MFSALLKTMRPRQWSKNIFVFAALVFDKQLLILNAFLRTTAGFVLFCLISSAVYIFNDLADIEADREHPEKKNRPIPSGKLPLGVAWTAGIVLVCRCARRRLPCFRRLLRSWSPAYFVLNLAYSKWLKHILDPGCARTGSRLRAAGRRRRDDDPRRTFFTLAVCGDDLAGALPGLWQTARRIGLALEGCQLSPQSPRRLHHSACSTSSL